MRRSTTRYLESAAPDFRHYCLHHSSVNAPLRSDALHKPIQPLASADERPRKLQGPVRILKSYALIGVNSRTVRLII